MRNPFRYFNSSPEIIRLTVMMYVRYPLSLRQVEDLLFERGIDICHETVLLWWNWFGPMFAAALQEAGVDISAADVCDRFLGFSTAAMLRVIEAEHGCRLPDAFQETLRARVLKAFEHGLAPVPGVPVLLDALAVDRCVASSSHPERIRRSLELAGILDRFAPHLFSAAMVDAGKPAPDLFLLAAARMSAEPSRCLVIEDSEVGIRAAKAAAMTAFGFAGASHVRPETHGLRLQAAGADAILAEMLALAGLIGRFD